MAGRLVERRVDDWVFDDDLTQFAPYFFVGGGIFFGPGIGLGGVRTRFGGVDSFSGVAGLGGLFELIIITSGYFSLGFLIPSFAILPQNIAALAFPSLL
jgi:hypothetical protein